eukprot:1628021-Rhodomonas_salina.4
MAAQAASVCWSKSASSLRRISARRSRSSTTSCACSPVWKLRSKPASTSASSSSMNVSSTRTRCASVACTCQASASAPRSNSRMGRGAKPPRRRWTGAPGRAGRSAAHRVRCAGSPPSAPART